MLFEGKYVYWSALKNISESIDSINAKVCHLTDNIKWKWVLLSGRWHTFVLMSQLTHLCFSVCGNGSKNYWNVLTCSYKSADFWCHTAGFGEKVGDNEIVRKKETPRQIGGFKYNNNNLQLPLDFKWANRLFVMSFK